MNYEKPKVTELSPARSPMSKHQKWLYQVSAYVVMAA